MQSPAATEEIAAESNRRCRLGLYAWAGLLGAPAAWVLQLVVGGAMSARSCADQSMPHTANAGFFSVSGVAIVLALLCAILATRGFLLSETKEVSLASERADDRDRVLPRDEKERFMHQRFVAACSVIVGASCVIGLLFTVLAEIFRASCGLWH